MDAPQDYQSIGRFIYGTNRAGFQLALLMDMMGKPLLAAQPGDKLTLAEDTVEAEAMFARLAVSAEVKAEFSTRMQSLAMLAGRLERIQSLTAGEIAESAAAAEVAKEALARYCAMVGQLLGPAAP
jgi:hypothetical protein